MNLTSFSESWPQSHAAWGRGKSSKLTLQLDEDENVTVLRCRGRISYREEAAELSKKVTELLPHSRHLILELSGVELIDSAGLGELVMVLLWTQASGCSIKLAAPRRNVRELLELTNLASVFEIYPTLADATRAHGPVA
jgi:anti-sigma B factor antagonist